MLTLDVYNTHMELYPYKKDDYPAIEDMYTATDKFTNTEFACGYTIENGKLYLPRGTSISKVEYMTGCKVNYINKSDNVEKMSRQFYPLTEPRDRIQEESIKFLQSEDPQLSLNLFMGLGKAQPLSTKIPTPNGYKRMGDLVIGDKIFGSDGKQYNVTGVFPQGVKDVYEITFSDGRKARCCKEHLWNVIDGSTTKTLSLEEIIDTYVVERPAYGKRKNGNKVYKYRIPLLSNPVQYDEKPVPIDPYVFGAFISTGCYRSEYLEIIDTNDYISKKIAEICGFTYKRERFTYRYRFLKDGKYITTREFFKDIPLVSLYDYLPMIPESYIYNSVNVRMELIRGLFDGNGRIVNSKKYTVTYPASSSVLCSQIKKIIFSLGYLAEINKSKKQNDCIYEFVNPVNVIIPIDKLVDFFTNPSKLKDSSIINPSKTISYSVKIRDIRKITKEECQCIMVDSPDHLYLTENFIVTHNTFCVAYASTLLNEKTLVITPNESIKNQWINTYTKMFDYRTKNIMNIAGSNIIESIMEDHTNIDDTCIFLVNHQTLQSYMSQTNGYQFHKFFKKLAIGIKVYDESHLNFGNIMLIDFFSNTKRTWYLTATFDRSDKTESACFKRAFQSVINYGEKQSEEVIDKHVIYHIVNINSKIDPKNRARLLAFPGFSATKFGRYAFFDDPLEIMYKSVLKILEMTKQVEGKTLIFVPIIDAVNSVTDKLKRDFPDKSVAAYHSKISKDEKESAEKKDIIVSTIKSTGTGKDIPNLRIVINCEPVASKVLFTQTIGRLRPYKNSKGEKKDTYFFDMVDVCIAQCNYFFRARFKKAETLVKEVKYLNIE